MLDAKTIIIPLINPNEPEILLVEVLVQESQGVKTGDPLCSLETTKSTQVLTAESDGYIRGLRSQAGNIVHAGDILCYIAGSPQWQPPEPASLESIEADAINIPEGLRISQPALNLAREKGIDISELPKGLFITEDVIRGLLDSSMDIEEPSSLEFDPSAIVVYGGGGHGKSLIDLLRVLEIYRIVGIVDDGIRAGEEIMDIKVLGGRSMLSNLYTQGVRSAVNAVGGIGNISIRIKVFEQLTIARFLCPTVIHPSAFIESSAVLSSGIQVFPHAYIGSQSQVGFGVIVNTSAVISHDCIIGDYSIISPGAILAGEVELGKGVLIGMAATINLQAKIGDGARIGNGSTVKSDVPENGIVRAGSIWPA